MSEVSRRSFLKMSGTAAGAAAVSGSGGASLTGLVKETKKIKPVKKLSTYAKAYRQFLKDPVVQSSLKKITADRAQPVSSSLYSVVMQNRFFDKKKMIKKSTDIARGAFKEATSKLPSSDLQNLSLYSTKDTAVTKKGDFYTTSSGVSIEETDKQEKKIKSTARTALARERQLTRSEKKENKKPKEPKKTTKRQLLGKAFRKLKGAIRGGFGGPKPMKVVIASRTPERVSGYHY